MESVIKAGSRKLQTGGVRRSANKRRMGMLFVASVSRRILFKEIHNTDSA